MNIEYFNYLTVPSGGKYRLKEINTKSYIILLKYLNGDNNKDFFRCLNEIIKESIVDFENFNLLDKAYTFIAFFYYSVKPILNIKSNMGFEEFLDLADMLNEIEGIYHPIEITIGFVYSISILLETPNIGILYFITKSCGRM